VAQLAGRSAVHEWAAVNHDQVGGGDRLGEQPRD
jgi:hypothetical protein